MLMQLKANRSKMNTNQRKLTGWIKKTEQHFTCSSNIQRILNCNHQFVCEREMVPNQCVQINQHQIVYSTHDVCDVWCAMLFGTALEFHCKYISQHMFHKTRFLCCCTTRKNTKNILFCSRPHSTRSDAQFNSNEKKTHSVLYGFFPFATLEMVFFLRCYFEFVSYPRLVCCCFLSLKGSSNKKKRNNKWTEKNENVFVVRSSKQCSMLITGGSIEQRV